MGMFGFVRRQTLKPPVPPAPAFVRVPPRGSELIAEVPEGQITLLTSALLGGDQLELGHIRAARVAGGRFLVQTRHGSFLTHDAITAVQRLLIEDAQDRELLAA